MPTVWTVYLRHPGRGGDPPVASSAAGGQVVTAPLPVDGAGSAALAADPEGAVFGLWQAAGHPGFGVRAPTRRVRVGAALRP